MTAGTPRPARAWRLPFWVQSGMTQGVVDRDGEPLAAEGASVEGLRLLCGDLVVRVEYGSAVVQVAVRGVERFPEDGAIRVEHSFGLRMPPSARRIFDFWSIAGRPVPPQGWGRGAGIAS